MVHTFNPRPRENYKMGGDNSQILFLSEVFWKQDHNFWTEVEVRANGWLFYFPNIQVEFQFLSLSFY